jgi:hypothetical protein
MPTLWIYDSCFYPLCHPAKQNVLDMQLVYEWRKVVRIRDNSYMMTLMTGTKLLKPDCRLHKAAVYARARSTAEEW